MTNNAFCCEICGTTTPKDDIKFTVLWRSDEGIIDRHVCLNCLNEINKDPCYLYDTSEYLPTYEFYEFAMERKRKSQERNDKITEHNNRIFDSYKNFQIERHIAGTKRFSGWVDVTDPCYGSQSYYGKQVYIADGEYTCAWWNYVYDEVSEKYNEVWHHNEMDVMGLYLNGKIPAAQDMVYIGWACMDGGRIGFFDINENLKELVGDAHLENSAAKAEICDVGFVGNADDGSVSVYAYVENGEVVALEVRLFDYVPRT